MPRTQDEPPVCHIAFRCPLPKGRVFVDAPAGHESANEELPDGLRTVAAAAGPIGADETEGERTRRFLTMDGRGANSRARGARGHRVGSGPAADSG